MSDSFTLDGRAIPCAPGQSILQAASAAGVFIPHLCFHPEFRPQGSCKLCTVRASGRLGSACTLPATPGLSVESDTAELNARRRVLLQLLFVEGNHFCPACEKSGDCLLQATAYALKILTPEFVQFYPHRAVDASHPDILLDMNRCILCGLCVEASHRADGKDVFALAGRGLHSHIVVNSASGRLGDSTLTATDRAAHICPVGAILPKRQGFHTPIGERKYDHKTVAEQEIAGESE
ncbi:MAG: (2Fe-2S)-binding protein [Nitrosomonadales bacterium]|nr:(2Fe-2S)-binding protein [Nitrosomonadales bacterium]